MTKEQCKTCKQLNLTKPHIKRFCDWYQMPCKLIKDCNTTARKKTPAMERKRRLKADRERDRERLANLEINKDKKRSAKRLQEKK